MYARQNIIEERGLNIRKRQAYTKIGVVSPTKRKLTGIFPFKPYFPTFRKKSQKDTIFSLKDGTTNFVIKNEIMAEKVQQKLKWLDISISVLTICNLVIWTLENEAFYKNDYIFDSKVNLLRKLYIGFTVPIVALTLMRHKFNVVFQKQMGELQSDITLYDWEILPKVLLEMLYNSIVPLPDSDTMMAIQQRELETEYSLNDCLYLVSFLKIYWIKRMLQHFSLFGDFKAEKICQHYHKKADLSFAVRAHIRKDPFLFESILMLVIILIFSVPLRIFEKALGGSLGQYENDMWLMTLVFSTLGYGEITPLTNLGRLTTAIAAYIGVFLFSLLIVSMTDLLALSKLEIQAYNYIEKTRKFKYYQVAAANLIKKFMRYALQKNKKEQMLLRNKDKTRDITSTYLLEVILHKKRFQSSRIELEDPEECSDTIIQKIRDESLIDLGTIKNRVSKLNLDQYQKVFSEFEEIYITQICSLNEEALWTFQKATSSCNMSQNIAKALEDLILENYTDLKSLKPNLEASEKSVKNYLQCLKQECLNERLIGLKDIQGPDSPVFKKHRAETESLIVRKRRNAKNLQLPARSASTVATRRDSDLFVTLENSNSQKV